MKDIPRQCSAAWRWLWPLWRRSIGYFSMANTATPSKRLRIRWPITWSDRPALPRVLRCIAANLLTHSCPLIAESQRGHESHAKSGMEAASYWLAPPHAPRLAAVCFCHRCRNSGRRDFILRRYVASKPALHSILKAANVISSQLKINAPAAPTSGHILER